MKAIPADVCPDEQCEFGSGVECERPAKAWTIEGGSGYVVACAKHAQRCVDDAVACGEIYPVAGARN